MKFKQITVIDARDMPHDVEEWCIDYEISTHYKNDVAQIENDGNPFAEWLNSEGYEWNRSSNNGGDTVNCDYIAILAT